MVIRPMLPLGSAPMSHPMMGSRSIFFPACHSPWFHARAYHTFRGCRWFSDLDPRCQLLLACLRMWHRRDHLRGERRSRSTALEKLKFLLRIFVGRPRLIPLVAKFDRLIRGRSAGT